MDSLLRWSIENSVPGTADASDARPAPPPRQDLDPAIIDHILGKPDAVLMQEALAIARDAQCSEDERVQALDDFEMLIENIDNANNVEKLKMWEPLHDLLKSPTSTDAIKMQTLWVIGTCLQNNPAAQSSFLSIDPLPTLLSFLSPSITQSAKTRSKAVYALSGLLKHNAAAVTKMDEQGGWDIFRSALEDSDITVRRKVAFLLNSLLIPSSPPPSVSTSRSTSLGQALHTPASPSAPGPVHANSHASALADPSSTNTSPATFRAMREKGLLKASVDGIVDPVPWGPDGENEVDIDFEEKVVRLLYTYAVACDGEFSGEVKDVLRRFFERKGEANDTGDGDNGRWGLEAGEMDALKRAVT